MDHILQLCCFGHAEVRETENVNDMLRLPLFWRKNLRRTFCILDFKPIFELSIL